MSLTQKHDSEVKIASAFAMLQSSKYIEVAASFQHIEAKAFWVTDAKVFGKLPVILCDVDEGVVCLAESSPYEGRASQLYSVAIADPDNAREYELLSGEYVFLCGEWSDNFWHWFTENFIYAAHLEECGYCGKYIVWNNSPLFRESLLILGVPQDRIIQFDWRPVSVERLLVFERHTGLNIEQAPALLNRASSMLQSLVPQSRCDERLYVARRGVRRIVNDAQVRERLAPYSFKEVYMEDYPLREQIGMASRAECIFGPHGAGMTAAMFMKPRGRIIEAFAPTYVNPCVIGVCSALSHTYSMLVSRQFAYPYPYKNDIFVNYDMLDAALRPLCR